VYFMHGNRDFLLGQRYAARCGMRILPDPSVINLFGQPALLLHGDTLCTDDVAYQGFRAQVRDPAWQANFLRQPIDRRRAFAEQARAASRQHQATAASAIMDVNPGEVERVLRRFGVRRMIHGHTHRPAVHRVELDGAEAERIVLGDWYAQGSSLLVSPDTADLRQH
jgi:UDP-2,3-diacylglucosamine hydrolase